MEQIQKSEHIAAVDSLSIFASEPFGLASSDYGNLNQLHDSFEIKQAP